jgi:hypothetical protein
MVSLTPQREPMAHWAVYQLPRVSLPAPFRVRRTVPRSKWRSSMARRATFRFLFDRGLAWISSVTTMERPRA